MLVREASDGSTFTSPVRTRKPHPRGRFHAKSDIDGPLPAHIFTVSRRPRVWVPEMVS